MRTIEKYSFKVILFVRTLKVAKNILNDKSSFDDEIKNLCRDAWKEEIACFQNKIS